MNLQISSNSNNYLEEYLKNDRAKIRDLLKTTQKLTTSLTNSPPTPNAQQPQQHHQHQTIGLKTPSMETPTWNGDQFRFYSWLSSCSKSFDLHNIHSQTFQMQIFRSSQPDASCHFPSQTWRRTSTATPWSLLIVSFPSMLASSRSALTTKPDLNITPMLLLETLPTIPVPSALTKGSRNSSTPFPTGVGSRSCPPRKYWRSWMQEDLAQPVPSPILSITPVYPPGKMVTPSHVPRDAYTMVILWTMQHASTVTEHPPSLSPR